MGNSMVYIAAAGSGKTSFILEQVYQSLDRAVDAGKYLIIVTYTSKNQENIKERIIQKYGYIPKAIVVVGWYTFLLDFWIRPFKGSVINILYDNHVGMVYVEGQSGVIKTKDGRTFTTYHTPIEKFLDNKQRNLYSDKLSEFAYQCYETNPISLLERLSNIADAIFIDEAQDLSGWDFEIIKVILRSQSEIKCILCGDPRQHTYSTSACPKNKKYNGKINLYITEKVNTKRKIYADIDTTTLNLSHRCVQQICDFASKVSSDHPKSDSCKCAQCNKRREEYSRKTGMFLLKKEDILTYITEYNPISLVWDSLQKPTIKTETTYNYGESKGLQADSSLIYPTTPILDFLRSGKNQLKAVTKSKLYVAITRARYSAAIVVDNDFDNSKIALPFWGKEKSV